MKLNTVCHSFIRSKVSIYSNKTRRGAPAKPGRPYIFLVHRFYDFTTFTNLLAFPLELLMFTRA